MVGEKRPYKNERTEKIKDLEKYSFTRAEIAIIDLLEGGFSNKEIAKILLKSEKTIKSHLTNIYTKLSTKNRYQLIIYLKRLESRYNSQS